MGTRMYPVFKSTEAERTVICAAMGIALAVWDKLEAWKGTLVTLQTAHWQGRGSHEAVAAHYDALYADDELSRLYSFELNGFGKVVPQAYGLMGVEPSDYGSAEGVTAKRGMLAQVLYRAQDGSFSWQLEIAQHPDVVGCTWD
jgi:hypothetical protein